MNKKIVIIIIIFGVLAIGAGVYFAWQKSGQQPQGTASQATDQNNYGKMTLPISGTTNSKMRILSKENVLAYWVDNFSTSTAGQDVFYISSSGNINKISGGNETTLSNENFGTLKFAKALAISNKILIVFKQDNSVVPIIFNLSTGEWQPLLGQKSATAVDLSLDGKKIAYLVPNSQGTADLFTLDLTNNKAKAIKLTSLNIKDIDLKWINDNNIVFMPKSSFDFISEVWDYNIQAKTFSKIAGGSGLMLNWSKFGDVALEFSAAQNKNYSLSLIDNNGNIKGGFKFLTFPDKCFISSPSQIYCAVSRDQNAFNGLTLPDDYLKRGIYFKDGIYQVDITQNKFQALFEGEDPVIDATNLTLDGSKLLFINRYDNKLYSLDI